MGRRSTINQDIVNYIQAALLRPNGHTRLTTERLYKELSTKLKKTNNPLPGKAAFIKAVTDAKKLISEAKPSPLDAPWCVGACLAHSIAPGAIALLAEYKSVGPHVSAGLTIRVARWIARLFPVLSESLTDYPGGHLPQIGAIFRICEQYAVCERMSEIKGEDHPDTLKLDTRYIGGGQISPESIVDGLASVYCSPEECAELKERTNRIREWAEKNPEEWAKVSKRITTQVAQLTKDGETK